MTLQLADLFCGAGGSSTGALRALREAGLDAELVAVNHWARAIETHAANHPTARHLRADVYHLDPREAVPGGRLDLLLASPTCTFFSRARGGRPISWDQRYGRMTPTQVIRWITELDVRALVVENVPEFRDWGPVSRATGKPRRERRGTYFRAWLRRLERAGYRHTFGILNSADYGDATTRQRFYLLAVKGGPAPRLPRATHSRQGGRDLFGATQRWRPALEVIDLALPTRSIFRATRPLAPKTLARIYAGMVAFRWPRPFLAALEAYCTELGVALPSAPGEEAPVAGPFLLANRTNNVAKPFVLPLNQSGDRSRGLASVDEPLGTIVTKECRAIVEPFVLPQGSNAAPRALEEPAPTVVAIARPALVEPFVLSQGAGGAPRGLEQPIPTNPARGAHALIAPYYGTARPRSAGEPLPTVTTRDRFGLVVPVTHAGARRARELDEPLPTVTAARELAFFTASFGEREGQRARVRSVDEPAPTVCARGSLRLVVGAIEASGIDVRMRMLQPQELAGAMGFPAGYEIRGNKTERTRQIGNAVTPGVMAALVRELLPLIAPAREAASA